MLSMAPSALQWLSLCLPSHHHPCPQEIAGHEEMVGQYESYKSFTMPQLYRVVEVRGVRQSCLHRLLCCLPCRSKAVRPYFRKPCI